MPIVIAHGEYKWRSKIKLSSIVDVSDEAFRVYLPDFEYSLFDVNVEDIRGYAFHSALKSLFALWQISPKREFLDELKAALMHLFQDLDEKQLDRFLKILVHYLSQARPSEELPEIMEVIRSLPAGGETMETIAEMLEKRGEERGISLGEKRGEQRGKLENSREMLLEAVSERFGMVSSDLVRRINSIESHETLKMLFKQTFRMESLDEFKEQVHRATDN